MENNSRYPISYDGLTEEAIEVLEYFLNQEERLYNAGKTETRGYRQVIHILKIYQAGGGNHV
jgi:uncharacterized protein YktA (UPF0223 family)